MTFVQKFNELVEAKSLQVQTANIAAMLAAKFQGWPDRQWVIRHEPGQVQAAFNTGTAVYGIRWKAPFTWYANIVGTNTCQSTELTGGSPQENGADYVFKQIVDGYLVDERLEGKPVIEALAKIKPTIWGEMVLSLFMEQENPEEEEVEPEYEEEYDDDEDQ